MDIQSLVSRGCFGKGIFSRSTPTHGRLPPPPGEGRGRRRHDDGGGGGELLEEFERVQMKRVDLHGQWRKLREEKERKGVEGDEDQWLKEGYEGEGKESSVWQQRMPEKKGVQGKTEERQRQEEDKERGMLDDECQDEVQSLEHTTAAAGAGQIQSTKTTSDTETITVCTLESTGMHIDSSSESHTVPAREATVFFDERKRYDDFVLRMKALVDRDPYRVTEYLQLSSEEAFYLLQELGELVVSTAPNEDHTLHTYSPAELWSIFCGANSRFLERYVAYRYFRREGWVPKSGLKLGVDFLLYKDGPAVYHSSYAVIVRAEEPPSDGVHLRHSDLPVSHLGHSDLPVSHSDLPVSYLGHSDLPVSHLGHSDLPVSHLGHSDLPVSSAETEGDSKPVLMWQDVISYCRVSESVAKDLLVCYITPPVTPSSDHHMEEWRRSPECVTDFTVKEVLVKRWVPDRERSAC